MSFYTNARALADSLLGKFNQGTITLNRVTFAASNVSTPWLPGAQTTTSLTLSAVVSGVKKEHLADTLIQAADLVVTCGVTALSSAGAEVDISPELTDVVVINGRAHEIKKIKQIPPSGTPAAFQLIVAG